MAKNELKGKTGKLLDDLMNGERNKDKGRWKGDGREKGWEEVQEGKDREELRKLSNLSPSCFCLLISRFNCHLILLLLRSELFKA